MCIRDRALAKLAEEDPTFRAHTDQETGQTIIAGMGELHLELSLIHISLAYVPRRFPLHEEDPV